MSLTLRTLPGVDAVEPAAWDALLGPDDSPFLEHAFLSAVEAASAIPRHGVLPAHLAAFEGPRLVAALPLYVKGDARGEFAYDWSFELLADRHGLPYYPKAVSMAPFTPAEAARPLVAPGADRAGLETALLAGAEDWARRAGLTGLHLLYLPADAADRLEREGWLRRLGWQLAWTRREEERDLESLLGRLRSKERVKIKRERRRLEEAGLRVELVEGDAIGEEHRDALWTFWSDTCARYGTGSRYLQRRTWELLFARFRPRLLLVCARDAQARLVAGALCVHKGGQVWGRYWGSAVELPGLYFNLTMYRPLELMAERGWRRFHLGAGQADYKLARGFEPLAVHGAHRLFEPRLHAAVERFLTRERAAVAAQIEEVRVSGLTGQP